MEQFCKELLPRICVDYNNEEVQDIINAVDILMKRFVKEMEKTNPDIKIKDVVLCGSNAEKTRVWGENDEIEFDYLAVMKTWPGIESFRFEHCADGQMNAQYLVNVDENPFGSRQFVSLYPGVNEAFRKIMIKCVSEKCGQNLCANYQPLQTALYGCKFCCVSMKTGTLRFYFTEKSGVRSLHKLQYLWESKYKTIKSVNVNEICTQFKKSNNGFNFRIPYRLSLPEWCQCKNVYYERLSVPVDVHPVIEIDQSAKVHQEFRIFVRESYLLLPPSYARAMQTLTRNQWKTLKNKELAFFVLKLVFYNKRPRVKLLPDLDRSINYFLFPRSQHASHGCWRISSCLQERYILCETTEEHRSAYCLLKFLARLLNDVSPIQFKKYEIKVSVINHIKHCKTPRVGAHVCMLSILHEISLCKSKGIMEHPILHMNLYDMIGYYNYHCDTQSVIRFKVLILLLANEKDMYALEDLFNDLFSIKCICNQYFTLTFSRFYFAGDTKKDTFRELKKLIRNRKRNSSKDATSQLIMDINKSFKSRSLDNIDYINVL